MLSHNSLYPEEQTNSPMIHWERIMEYLSILHCKGPQDMIQAPSVTQRNVLSGKTQYVRYAFGLWLHCLALSMSLYIALGMANLSPR